MGLITLNSDKLIQPLNPSVIKACYQVIENNKRKGNTWITCDIVFLRRKLQEEYEEVIASIAKQDGCEGCLLRRELLDLINVASMLYVRLEK